jgi:hypothetical protein
VDVDETEETEEALLAVTEEEAVAALNWIILLVVSVTLFA